MQGGALLLTGELSAVLSADLFVPETPLWALQLRFLEEDGAAFSNADRDEVINDVMNEILGLGPLEPLMKDPSISDIITRFTIGRFFAR